MLKGLRQRIAQWRAARRPRPFRVAVQEDGFRFGKFGHEAADGRMRWSDIQEVRAFKRDLFAIDVICLGIWTASEQGIEVWESDEGYEDFVAALTSHLPGIDEEWWGKVAFPPFATNETVLYRRARGEA